MGAAGTIVKAGTVSINSRPVFLPERAAGLTVDTAGTTEGTISPGTVLANADAGASIFFAEDTDAGEGLQGTGWPAVVVETFCETDVVGRIVGESNQPVVGALVTGINKMTATTSATGEFSIDGMPLPPLG